MSARHRQQKKVIAEIAGVMTDIETRIASYAIVQADLDDSEVVAHVMLAMRRQELEIALGRAHLQLLHERGVLAAMPKRKEVARV